MAREILNLNGSDMLYLCMGWFELNYLLGLSVWIGVCMLNAYTWLGTSLPWVAFLFHIRPIHCIL